MKKDNLDPDRSASSHKRHKMNDTMQKQSGACAFAYFDDSISSEDGNSAYDEDLDEYTRAKIAIANYLQEPRSGFSDLSLLFWHTSYTRYPELATLSNRYLTSPISFVASECEFKVSRDIANGNRMQLRPQNVQKLLFLKYNLKAISHSLILCCFLNVLQQTALMQEMLNNNMLRVTVCPMEKCFQQKNKYSI